MANNMTNWDVEAQNIEQRRRYADALRSQSMEPIDPGQLPGVPISPFQGLAKVFKAYTAGQTERKAAEDSQNLSTRRNQALADALKGAFEPVPGQSEQRGPFQEGLVKPAVPGRQKTTEEISKALLGNPDTMAFGSNMMVQDATSRNSMESSKELARYKNQLEMDPAYIAAKNKAKGGDSPYFTPVQTGQGVFSFNARTGAMEQINAAGKPVIGSQSDPNLQAQLTYGKETGKQTGEVDVQQHETANAALENINKIDQLISHLNESDAITGMGSDFFKNIERAKVLVSNSEKAGKKVSDTELLDTMLGSEVFPLIKSLGIGARGMDTPAEREFMRSVLTGQTQLNKQTLIRMAEIRKEIANRAIKRWNDRVGTGELDRYFEFTGRPKGTVGSTGAPAKAPSVNDLLEKYK